LHVQAGDAKFVLHGKILMIRDNLKALIKHFGYDIVSTQQLADLRTDLTSITNKAPWVRYWLTLDQESRLKTLNLLPDSKSQLGQDLLAANTISSSQQKVPFFVEFGATNDITLSNTWLLEKKLGWQGILVEPAKVWHHDLRHNRNCIIDSRCLTAASGGVASFSEVNGGGLTAEYSTLTALANGPKETKAYQLNGNFINYDVDCITLTDLLDSHSAPREIDYMSVDTEGSEFEILNAFDFQRYKVKLLTIEHNYLSEKRLAINHLMSRNGYHQIFSEASMWDDWYILND
jgi:FkbM family methyltransferase